MFSELDSHNHDSTTFPAGIERHDSRLDPADAAVRRAAD
jgi:hypothetical protein